MGGAAVGLVNRSAEKEMLTGALRVEGTEFIEP